MKLLKQISILLISLLAVLLLLAAFVQKDYEVKRSVEIINSKAAVFDYIRYFENHQEFSIWQSIDPNIKQEYKGNDGELGAIYSWTSSHQDVGSGKQSIIDIHENEFIEYKLEFKEPMEMMAYSDFTLEGNSVSTKVTWRFNGTVSYPWNLFMLFNDMDAELGDDLQEGLDNLKERMESKE